MKPSILFHPPRSRNWNPSATIALGFLIGATMAWNVKPMIAPLVAQKARIEAASPTPAPIERKFPVIVSREGDPIVF